MQPDDVSGGNRAGQGQGAAALWRGEAATNPGRAGGNRHRFMGHQGKSLERTDMEASGGRLQRNLRLCQRRVLRKGRIPAKSNRRNGFVCRDGVQSSQRSEEHKSELQSLMRNSYAVF